METNSLLLPLDQWVEPMITLADNGDAVRFHIQDVFNYHGYDAVGGVVLGFRLLQRAIAFFSASETGLLERRHFTLFTAFPGLGARDCFELTTRMVSDNRFVLDTMFNETVAQEGVQGRFYYRFGYNSKSVELAPLAGYPGEMFLQLGRASKRPGFSDAQKAAWKEAKHELANTLLRVDAASVIRIL